MCNRKCASWSEGRDVFNKTNGLRESMGRNEPVEVEQKTQSQSVMEEVLREDTLEEKRKEATL